MILLQDYQYELEALRPQIAQLGETIDIQSLTQKLEKLDKEASAPTFWEDSERSQIVLQEAKKIRNQLTSYQKLSSDFEETVQLLALSIEMDDLSAKEDIKASVRWLQREYETQKLSTLLTGEYDSYNAILTFHAGSGGTEAQDWAEMLYRMYRRWAEQNGYRVQVLDYLSGDEAGIKSATILIEGDNVYGFLRSEAGVHRLVRVSPFDSSGRRHTSFAAIEVMPEIEDNLEIDIDEKDLRIDTYRASGAGGQHVNKTDSAVRITHLPTGVVVACQNERSQRQNKAVAMKMLLSKLVEIKEREHLEHIEDIKGDHKNNSWGSQIRSYVFMPYTMVKDHRTNHEEGNVSAVMDGEIDGFIQAYLREQKSL